MPALPSRRVQILTRRASLEEALSRHATSLGMTVTERDGAEAADIVVLDVSTYRDELKSMLATAKPSGSPLIAIATSADVETLGLRVLLHEKAVVLKPVHRIAIQEALAVASGVEVATSASAPLSSTNTPRLRGHVLLVEDEAVNAAVAEGYLSALGCTLAWVKSGNDAIARSGAERFDLIFMDLNMPGIDGFAAARLIREREAVSGQATRVPIVALTAHDAVNFRTRVLEAQMDDILSKPYSLEECTKILRRWLPVAAREDAPVLATTAATTLPTTSEAPPTRIKPAERHTTGGALASVDAAAVGALKKLRGGTHADLYTKLVDLFRTGSVDSMSQLRGALQASDLRTAASVCHKLAASAGNVGALAFAKQVRELEFLCVAGEASRTEEIHEALQAAHAPLIDALIGHTMRATA
jgi:CheY-like chemotaxis protein/HPt (histidine-containing phosphotransfer) domain-containing protein